MTDINPLKSIKRNVFLLVSLFSLFTSYTAIYSNTLSSINKVESITSISPTTGHAGTVVTITGIGFTSTSSVEINSVPYAAAGDGSGNVTYLNLTTINVIIPCGYNTGLITISVDDDTATATFDYIAPTVTTAVSDVSYCIGVTVDEFPILPTTLEGTPATPTIGTLEFKWTNSNTAIGLPAASGTGTNIPTFTANNLGIEPITSTITITPTINGCDGTPVSYIITINPEPIANPIADNSVCPGEFVNNIILTASSPITGSGGTDFTWSGTNNAAIGQTVASGINSPIPSFIATNATAAVIQSTFTVTPTYTQPGFTGCVGVPINFDITVNPASDAGTLGTTTPTICEGNSTTLNLTGNVGGIVEWQSSTDNFISVINTIPTTSPLTVSPITTTQYRAVVQSASCTEAKSNHVEITVDPPVIAGSVTGGSPICAGTTSKLLTLGGESGTVVRWESSPNNTDPWTDEGNAIFDTYTSGLLYNNTFFRAIVQSGSCGEQASIETLVTVDDIPVPGTLSATNLTICEGSTTDLSITPSTIGSIQSWEVNTGSGWTTLTAAGINTIFTATPTINNTQYRVLVGNGVCTPIPSNTISITVDPAINMDTLAIDSSTPTPVCAASTIDLNFVVSSGAVTGWEISTDGGTSWNTYTGMTTLSTTSYRTSALNFNIVPLQFKAIVTSGICDPIKSNEITVQVDAAASPGTLNFASGSSSPTCESSTVDLLLGGSYTGTILGWEYNNTTSGGWTAVPNTTTTANYTSFNLSETTDFRVLLDGGACGQITSAPLTVAVEKTPIISALTISSGFSSPVCSGSSIDLDFEIFEGTLVRWESSTDSGSSWNAYAAMPLTGANTYTTGPITGPIDFQAVVTSSGTGVCGVSNSTIISVNADLPGSGGTLRTASPIICENTNAIISLSPITGTIVGWEYSTSGSGGPWTRDTSNTTNTYDTGSLTSGSYTYRAASSNGVCGEILSTELPITVSTAPSITNITNGSICYGTTVTFGDPIKLSGHEYQWSSVSGGIISPFGGDSDLTVTILNPETYTLEIRDTATGCTASDSFVITALPLPVASVISDSPICEGDAIAIGEPNNVLSTYTWTSSPTYAGALTGSNPIVSPTVTTTFTLTETTTTTIVSSPPGCSDTQSVTITVEPNPTAAITIGPSTICETASNVFIEATITNNYTSTWEVVPASAGSLNILPTPTILKSRQVEFNPSASGILAGTATIRLTLTNTCGVDQIPIDWPITIERQSIADAGAGGATCDTTPFTLDGTGSQYATTYTWSKPGTVLGTLVPNGTGATATYTPSATDVANAATLNPITFTLITSSGSSCVPSAPSTVQVNIVPLPVISAGPATTTICENTTYPVTGASVDVNTASYSWSKSGDGSFSSITALNPIYIPGTIDKATGSVTLTLTAQGNTPCLPVTSNIILTIEKNPIVTVGAATTVCASTINPITIAATIQNAGTITWSTNGTGAGNFNGTENQQNPTYTPDISDLGTVVTFTVTVTPIIPCGNTEIETVNYTINAIPTVDAGGAATICETSTNFLLNATVLNETSLSWTHNGSGSFNGTQLNEDATYTLGTTDINTGFVTFTLTAVSGSCASVTDTMVLTIQKNPVADAGSGIAICQGDTAFVTNASATDSSSLSWTRNVGGGTLLNNTTINPSYISNSNEALTINLTLEASPIGPCVTPSSSSTTIIVVAEPTADAGDPGQICEGETFAITTATATNNTGLVNWSAGPTGGSFVGGNTINPTYTPSVNDINNGFATLTLTAVKDSPCFSDAIHQMTLTINKIPSINVIKSPLDVCTATAPFEITGVTAIDYDTLEWTGSGSGTFSPTPTPLNTTTATFYNPSAADIASGSVVLTLEAARDPLNCNSSTTNSVTLNFVKEPIVDAGPLTATICEGTSYTTTTATASNFSNVTWTSTGTGGWSNVNDVQNAAYTPSTADIGLGSVTLTLIATGLAPCFDIITDTIILNLEALPVITTAGTADICASETSFPIAGTSILNNYEPVTLANWTSTSTGVGNFSTSGDNLNPIFTPTAADITAGSVTLTLTVDPIAPCLAPITKDIVLTFIPEPIASAGNNLVQCETPFQITTATATAGTYSSLAWSSSSAGSFLGGVINTLNPTYIPSAIDITAGTVDLTFTAYALSPCTVDFTETITVSIAALPVITVTNQATICEDASNVQVLGTTITDALSFVYTSATGTTINNPTILNPIVIPSTADITQGYIELTIEALPIADCGTTPVTKIVTIPIERNPIVNAGTTQTICNGTNITTSDATALYVAGGNLQWSNNGGDGSFSTPSNSAVTTYQPGTTEIDNGQVRLTLTGIATSPCGTDAAETVTYNITKNPTLTVTPTIVEICEDATYQVQTGQVDITDFGNVDFVTWSATSGSISTSGPLDLVPIFTPNAAAISAGYSDLTITVTPIGACAANTLTEIIHVNISKNATIDATQTTLTFCEGVAKQLEATYTNEDSPTYNWTITSGTGSFSSTPGVTTSSLPLPQYFPASDSDVVEIRVEITNISPCANTTSDQFTLTKVATPIVTLTANTATVCSSEIDINLGATIVNPTLSTSYLWERISPAGTGNFSNPTPTSSGTPNLSTDYVFSAADILASSVTLRLTATSDAICALTDFDEIVITIEDEPTVTITNLATEVCQGETFNATATATDASTYLWETVGASDGTFTDLNSLTLAEYTPGTNDISTGSFTIQITATGTASCGTAIKQQTVNIIPLPSVDAGLENRTNCASEDFVITGVTALNSDSILWTSESGTPGTFSNTSIENPTYTPSAAEITANIQIVLRVTVQPIAPCLGSVNDFIILTLSPVQVVDAGLPQSICEDEIVNLVGSSTNSSSVFWTTSSSGTDTDFSNPNSGTTTYTPSTLDLATGNVTLTLHAVSATSCPEITDSILITIIKTPTANAGGPATICEGDSYTLAASEATAQNYDSLLWTVSGGGSITAGATTLTPTFTPSAGLTGDVILTLTAFADANCGTANDVFSLKTITIVPSPFASVPATGIICQGTALTILDSEVTATNYSSVSWASSNGLGTFSPSTSTTSAAVVYTPAAGQTGAVDLILTAHAIDASCSDATASMSLSIEPALIVEAGIGGTICEDETFTVLGATITNGPITPIFTWSIVGPATFVAGTETTLTPQILPNAGASGTVTVTLTANGTINCPTAISDDVTITINSLPIVDAGLPIPACEGVTEIQLEGTGTNGVTYTWTETGAGFIQATTDPLRPKYIPAAADFINPSGITVVTVFLEATGIGTCGTVQDFMEITLYANPTIYAGNDLPACEGDLVTLSGATAVNYSAITWDNNGGNGTFDYTTAGGIVNPTYTLGSLDIGTVTLTMTATPNVACTTPDVTSDIIITVQQKPIIVVTTTVPTNEITLCAETFTLPDLVTITNASSILWTNTTIVGSKSTPVYAATKTPTLTPTVDEIANGFILLTLTALPNNPCTGSVQETIRVNLLENPTVEAGTAIIDCEDTNPILLNFAASVSPSTSFYWTEDGTGTIDPGTVNNLQPSYTPGSNETGIITFTLHAANPPPCIGETIDTVTLTLTPQPTMYAGGGATICEGSSYNLINATATDYTSILWESYTSSGGTTTSDGTFFLTSDLNPTYNPSANDITRGFVYLFARAANSCGVIDDYMLLTIASGVGVFAGVPETICEGTSYTLSGATADNSTSVSWISSENSNGTSSPTYSAGSFNTPNTLKTIYTPSADDINTGYVYLTLTGSGDLSCAIDTSVMRLDITPNPTITVTNAAMCVDTPSIVLTSVADDYNTINWSIFSGPGSITSGASTETPTFTTGLASTITTTQTTIARAVLTPNSGCSITIPADIIITIQPLPTVEAGDNGEVCYIAGSPIDIFTINNSSVTNVSSQAWSALPNIGTFSNGTPPTYQSLSNSCPSTEDLTLTATGIGACSTSTISDIVTLTINCAAPDLGVISSTASTTLCSGTSSVVYSVGTNPSVTTYNWTVPTGATIVSGINTSAITVDYGTSAVSGNVAVYATNSCGNGPFSTLEITVLPVPGVTSISTLKTTICAGETGVLFTASPLVDATSYVWTLPTGATGSSITNTITVDFGTSAVSGNISVQGVNSCGNGVVSSIAITVIALPTLTSITTTPICSGDPFSHPLASDPGVTFTWDRPITSGIDGTASGSGDIINDVLVNTTNGDITVYYDITLTSAVTCIATAQVSVLVYSAPQLINAPLVTEICSGVQFDFDPTSAPIGTISWTRNTITGIAEPGLSNITTGIHEILTNTTDTVITVDYEITLPATANGCTDTVIVSVDVNPAPSAATGITASATTICSDTSGYTFSVPTIPNATSYVWTVPTGASIASGANTNTITVDFDATAVSGTISVYGTSVCGDGATSSLFITVIPPATLSNAPIAAEICSGEPFEYLSPTSSTAVSFDWVRNPISGISTPVSSGTDIDINEVLTNTTATAITVTYTFTLTTANGCTSTEDVPVQVKPIPVLNNLALAPTEICSGEPYNTYTPSATPASTISWSRQYVPSEILEGSNSGTGTINDTSLTNITESTVTVVYNLSIDAGGCINTTTVSVDVKPLPSTPTISGPITVCAGSTGNIYTATTPNATSYVWTVPTGATIVSGATTNSITVDFDASAISGSLTVQGENGCGFGAVSPPLAINVIAPPTLSSPLTDEVCSSTSFNYTPDSSTLNVSYSWTRAEQPGIANSIGIGSSAIINETLINTTTGDVSVDYEYTLITDIGCTNNTPQTVTVIVHPSPTLDYTIDAPVTEICSGEEFNFNFDTILSGIFTAPPAPTVNWTREDILGIASSGSNTGSGTITETLTNSTENPITVVYNLELPPTDQGCIATETITVVVNPSPIAAIGGGGNTCFNSTDDLITFTGSNGTAPYTFEYSINTVLGNTITTTGTNNSIQVASSSSTIGTFTYTLTKITDANGCETSFLSPSPYQQVITVIAAPVLIITDPLPICENDTVDLTDAAITAGSDSGITLSYLTDATGTVPYYTPTAATVPTAGTYTYYIKATSTTTGCYSVEPVVITAVPLPEIVVNNPTICEGGIATISVSPKNAGDTYPSGIAPGTYTYSWTVPSGSFAPGNVATFNTDPSLVTNTYIYTVSIQSNDLPACESIEVSGILTVNPLPDATISGSATPVCVDDLTTVTFAVVTLGTTAPYTFEYNIDGGTTLSVTSAGNSIIIPIDTSVAGTFNINLLSVTDGSTTACAQAVTGQTHTVEVLPPPSLTITPPLPICDNGISTVDLSTTITPFDSGLDYTYWTSITATTSIANPNAVGPGTYYIKATYTPPLPACSSIAEVVVTGIALPEVTVNSETICEGDTATITATPLQAGSYNYSWTSTSGFVPGNVASFTTDLGGNYTVFITNQVAPYCESAVATGTVLVNPLPTATIAASSNEVCLNEENVTVSFVGAIGTAPYTFTYTDAFGATQTIVSGTATATATIPVDTSVSGDFTYGLVSVSDSSSTACSQLQPDSVTITVRDLPTVDAGLDIEVCAGEQVTLTASGTATSYIWNNGVVDGVPFTPTLSTTYTVIGTDSFGCENTAEVTVTIIPAITGTIKTPYDFEVCKDDTPPTITFVGANGTANYTFTYEIEYPTSPTTTSTITGSVTSTGNEAILVPEIPTTTVGVYTVTLVSVEDSGSCNNGEIIEPSQAFITILDAGIVPLNLIEVNQIVCENEPIVDILFEINGSPINAYVDDLPSGVTSEYVASTISGNPGILTITGSPNEAGTFDYTVITSGSLIGCNTTFPGTLTVNETGKLALQIPDSDIQEVCNNTPISIITYNIEGGATGVTVVFSPSAPAGISYAITGNTVIISGTPTETGIFNYTVETFSTENNCNQAIETGTLTITESEILLASGTPDQTICIDNAIEAINFSITTTPSTVPAASLVLVGTLPTGITFDPITGIITGTPTEGGTFPYSIEASTGCAIPFTGEIIVNDTLPNVLIENGLTDIEVCEGSEITLTATGADSYEWYELDTSGIPVSLVTTDTYTFTPTTNQTLYVIGTLVDGCDNTAQINIILKPAISASITGVNSFEVCKDETEPTITFTGTNGIAPYTFTYTINGIASTVTSINTSDSAVINIPTNIAGTYNIQLMNVEDSGSTNCSPPTLLEPTTAALTVLDSGVYPQAGAEIYQTICEDDSIVPILFDLQGDATNAYAEGLPSGVTSSFAGAILTISGTPTVVGSFDYTIVTSGLSAVCNSTFTGNITINENDQITLVASSDDNQIICECGTITPIIYELGGGATGANVTGLPSGINWNIIGNILTISGSSCDAGDYTYTIETQGICGSATETGDIEITVPASLALTSGNANEVICINDALTANIQYQGTAGQTLLLIGVLPPGVSFNADPATGSGVISGTPTLTGTYNYSITSENSCSDVLEGSIVVEGDAYINLSSGSINQVACVGSPIETLRYTIPLSVSQTDVTFVPTLPTGINYVVVNGELIISGTPTSTSAETPYVISATSNCGTPASTEFKLTIEESPVITLETDSGAVTQSVCQNNPISSIQFTVSPIGTTIDLSLLPSFITATEIDPTLGLWELTGSPISTGTFNFEIQTLGDSNCSASLPIQIENLYAAVSVVLDVVGSDNQTLCSFNDPIEDIVYTITGSISDPSIINVTGLPSGITVTTTSTASGILLTISGQSTESGIFEYEVIYDTCGTLRTGVIEISSPMTINSEVTQISCVGDDASISLEIFGGVPFIDASGNPFYAITWEGPNGFMQNQPTITGLEPGDYTISGTDAIGCAFPSETYTIEPLTPLYIELLDTTVATGCDGTLGCANLDYIGGTGIYTSFVLEYSNPQSQTWVTIQAANNNYYNICDLEAGLYRITVTDSAGCETEPFLFTIENGSQFSIDNLVLEESLCNGETGIILIEVNSIDPNLLFTFNGETVTSTALGNNFYELQINAGIATNGIISVTNSEGCSLSRDITLQTMEPDFEFTSLEFEESGYFEVNSSIEFTNLNFIDPVIYDPNIYTYIEWDFDDNTPFKTFYYPDNLDPNENDENIKTVFHTYTTDGIYNVTLTLYNTAGCSTSITKTIVVGEGASILLPTAFSPNRDGINDVFRPLFRGVSEISMYIYDNWGNLVYDYTSDDATALENDKGWGWNGIEPLNSEPKNGSYRCYIVVKTLDQKVIKKNGRLLIIQ